MVSRQEGDDEQLTCRKVQIVGLGGALREGSSSDAALLWIARVLEAKGAEMRLFRGRDLEFPAFDPGGGTANCAHAEDFVAAVRGCDALVISSPVYHGGPSGLIKNAIDHLQPLASDIRPYLTDRPVCCIAAGGGLHGAVSTLSSLGAIVHALRGWPTPMQVPINASARPFDPPSTCRDTKVETSLRAAADDLIRFARAFRS